jgi:hypothetical protein
VALAEVARGQAAGPEVLDDGGEDGRRGRDVEEALQRLADLPFEAGDALAEAVEGGLLVVAAAHVEGARGEPVPDVGRGHAAGELLDRTGGDLLEFGVGDRLATEADEVEIRRQQAVVREVVDRGDELAGGEVAGGAEDHDDGRRRAAVLAQAVQEGMTRGVCHRRRGKSVRREAVARLYSGTAAL